MNQISVIKLDYLKNGAGRTLLASFSTKFIFHFLWLTITVSYPLVWIDSRRAGRILRSLNCTEWNLRHKTWWFKKWSGPNVAGSLFNKVLVPVSPIKTIILHEFRPEAPPAYQPCHRIRPIGHYKNHFQLEPYFRIINITKMYLKR